MPTPTDIARAAAGAFIGSLWGRHLQHDEHGKLLAQCILKAAKEIEAEKDRQQRGRLVKDSQADSTFEVFWDLYAKKVGLEKCRLKWRRLSGKARRQIMEHVPSYVEVTPEHQGSTWTPGRMNPLTYLNGAYWLDEALPTNGAAAALLTHAEAVKELDNYGSATRLDDLFMVVSQPDGGRVMFQRKT